MEKHLTIEETFNLITANIYKRYSKLLEEGYVFKSTNENKTFVDLYKDYSREEKTKIRKELLESLKEGELVHDLPKYYLEDNNDSLSIAEKYNLYMLENDYKNSVGRDVFENKFLHQNGESYFIINVTSESSLTEELNSITKEEELEMFYDVSKEQISKDDFFKHLNEFVSKKSQEFFLNIGVKYDKKFNKLELTDGLSKDIQKSILKYIYRKNLPLLKTMNTEMYPGMDEKKFKLEFISGNIKLNEKYIDISLLNSLNMVVPTLLNNRLSKVSLEKLKYDISLASSDFDSFLKENKDEVSEIVLKLLEHSSENVKNLELREDLDELRKSQKISKKESFEKFIKTADQSLIINSWNKVKGFAYEKLLSHYAIFKELSHEEMIFPTKISKVFKDKIYDIDFVNNIISWGFVNEEKDYEYYQDQKQIFNQKKVALMHDNPDISKDDLKRELNPILSRDITEEKFLDEVGYKDKDFLDSNFFMLNNILIQNIELFIDTMKKEHEYFEDRVGFDANELDTDQYVGKNNITILMGLIKEEGIEDADEKNHIVDFILKLNNRNEDIKTIESTLSYMDNEKENVYKNIFQKYYFILQENMISLLSISSSTIVNKTILSSEYCVDKLFYMMEEELDKKDQELEKEEVSNNHEQNLDNDFNFGNDLGEVDNFFDDMDSGIFDNISEVDDFLSTSDLDLSFEE